MSTADQKTNTPQAPDLILVLTGGLMQGVFGAGVVTAFQEADVYSRIHSVYTASAGAHNAAYFLAHQSRLGSSIYYEDLTGRQFIHPERFFGFVWDCLVHWFDSAHAVRSVVDLEYLITTVEQQRKPLDVPAIQRQSIPWYIHAFDCQARTWEWLDGTDDTHTALRVTSSSTPYYPYTVSYHGRKYIDASIIRSSRLLEVARAHPDKRIIYVRNRRRAFWRDALALPNRLMDVIITCPLFGWRIGWMMLRTSFAFPSRRQIARLPNVLLIENMLGSLSIETNAAALRRIYEHGIAAGQVALKQL